MIEDLDALPTCEWCGGDFLPEDMDGDHCAECADEIFRSEVSAEEAGA